MIQNNELDQMLGRLKEAKYPKQIDVTEGVMSKIAWHMAALKARRQRIGWTIGAGSVAAAVAVLVIIVGNGTSTQAKNADKEGIYSFMTDVYGNEQSDVVYYDPDYIDILLGMDNEEL